MRSSLIFVVLILFSVVGVAQHIEVELLVKDTHGHSIPGAHLHVIETDAYYVSDEMGSFSFQFSKQPKLTVEISFLGFETLRDTLKTNTSQILKVITLHSSSKNIDELIVVGHKHVIHNAQDNVELDIDDLSKFDDGTLVNNLERIPGINAMNIGVGIAKPVIRGLSSNRVLVNVEGSKQEGQQWGSDHGLEIDQFDVSRLEIVKGPSSLMYGSDGLGGVINILPDKVPQKGHVEAMYRSVYKSNNNYFGNSLSAKTRLKDVFVKVQGSTINYSDYVVPTDHFLYNTYRLPIENNTLINTAGKERNAALELGLMKKWGSSRIKISQYNLEAGFFPGAIGIPRVNALISDGDNSNISLPKQDVKHTRVNWNSKVYIGESTLSGGVSYQENLRKEFSEPHAHGENQVMDPLALQLDLETVSGFIHWETPQHKNWKFTYGANGQYQSNSIKGFELLIPAYKSGTVGVFSIVEKQLSKKLNLTGGGRLESTQLKTEELESRFELVDEQYFNYAASLGMVYSFRDKTSLKLNAGKSFRTPSIAELASNGIHHGTFRHERGDGSIVSEQGYQLDVVVQHGWKNGQAKLSGFYNYFEGFIYLAPTNVFSGLPEGNQVYQFKQNNAIYYGGEATIEQRLMDRLDLSVDIEVVLNKNLDTELPLPFTPATSTTQRIEYTLDKFKAGHKIQIGASLKEFWDQNNVDRNEAVTKGATICSAWVSGTFYIGKFKPTLQFRVDNLFDVVYKNHLSRYRILNLPEQGRNFILSLKLPLVSQLNKSN